MAAYITEAERRGLKIPQGRSTKPRIADFPDWLPAVTPDYSWHWPHLRFIYAQLDRVTRGEIRKLMLFLPPRHGKSEAVTVRYSAWILERNPTHRVIIGAYNQFLANMFSRKIKRIVQGRIPLAKDRIAVEQWETAAEGGVRAVGVGAGVTGQGGSLIVIDDPIKSRAEAESEVYRDSVWKWYTDDLYTRQEPNAAIVLIMTRWHHDDLAARILKSEDGPHWTVINLPAEAELNDPLGRKEGEALCPERFDLTALQGIKSVLGAYSYLALYQQRPTPTEGGLIKLPWFKRYTTPPAHFVRLIQSWDTANKAKELNDPWACTTWGETETGYYLLDCFARQMEYPEGKRTVRNLAEKWHPSAILIEDKSSGMSLLQDLREETKLPVLAIEPEGDKVTRASVNTPTIEAGLCWLPESAEWLFDFESEIAAFPNGAHDDRVDSLSQSLAWLTKRKEIDIW